MVFTVRCFKCGEQSVRLVLGGRAILHARCEACNSNLLADVLEFEEAIERGAGEAVDEPDNEFTEGENTREVVLDPEDEELLDDDTA